MKVSKTVSHRINMGNYESLTLGASVEIDTDDLPADKQDEVLDEIDAVIADALAPDLKIARRLSKDSYIRDYTNNPNNTKDN